jgi:hypothetical protein
VPTFAEIEESLAREMRLIESDRFDAIPALRRNNVTLTACVWPNLTFNDRYQSAFDHRRETEDHKLGGVRRRAVVQSPAR